MGIFGTSGADQYSQGGVREVLYGNFPLVDFFVRCAPLAYIEYVLVRCLSV